MESDPGGHQVWPQTGGFPMGSMDRVGAPPAQRSRTGFRAPRRGQVEVVAPGHVRAWSSNRHFTVMFAGSGLAFGALMAGVAFAKENTGPLWILETVPLLFAAVGLLLPTERSAIEIEPSRVRLERWVRWKKRGTWELPRDAVRRVRVRREVYRTDRSTRVTHPVSIVLEAPGVPNEVVVQETGRETDARRTAERLSRELRAPLEDALGAEPELRPPDALDRAVAREMDPGAPPDPSLRRLPGLYPEVEIQGAIRGPASGAVLVAALSVFLAVPFVLVAGLGVFGGGWIPLAGAAAVGLIDVAVAGLVLSPLVGRHRIRLETGTLHHEVRLAGLRVRHQSLAAHAVEQIRLEETTPLGGALSVVSDERVVRVRGGFDRATLDWLRRWLAHHIGS